MVPPAVGEQPIKAVVNSILPDDMYRVDYLDDNRYWGPKVWSYSQLIVGWPNEEDDAVDADEEEPTEALLPPPPPPASRAPLAAEGEDNNASADAP